MKYRINAYLAVLIITIVGAGASEIIIRVGIADQGRIASSLTENNYGVPIQHDVHKTK
jgi:hypothetical protein